MRGCPVRNRSWDIASPPKAAQGLYPSFAPLGYLNIVGSAGKRIIVPDPVQGSMIGNLFTWFASGEYALKALASKAFEEGFRFRKSRSKVPTSTLHKVLRNRIYTGEFDYAGKTYQGIHEPLVTRETWERVQEILDGLHEKKHRKVTHAFAFSGLVNAGTADVPWWARSRRHATFTIVVLGIAANARSRIRARRC